MVDAPALGAGGVIHGGSSPLLGTIMGILPNDSKKYQEEFLKYFPYTRYKFVHSTQNVTTM